MFDFLIRPFRRNFGKDKMFYRAVDDMFGFIPHNIELYKLALIHKSASIVLEDGQHINNERLEFLGDAVLSSVTADFLYSKFSKEREGFLTKSRSNLVCRERLNELAVRIGLDKYLIACGLPHQHNSHVYGNALEALIGAIYIDKGYKYCRRFLLDKVFSQLSDIESVVKSDKNYKSRLIEWGQKRHIDVDFRIVSEQMRKEGAFFISEALVGGEVCGVGEGFSKRESQQKAARQALLKLEE
jgi:ribonuclease-3